MGLLANTARGQIFDSVQVPMDPRLSDLPYYSFNQGLGLTTPDSTYSMNIRFRMQLRAANTFNDSGIVSNQWSVRRLRLRFDGFAFVPNLTYAIQLSFATEDASGEIENNNLNLIRDAVLFYRINRQFSVGFGQTKLPGNRQRVNSSSALQMVDRSIANAAFTIDRDFGFFGIYRGATLDEPGIIARAALSSGKGRNWRGFENYGLCYTGRLEWYPLGDFTNNGVFFEGDLQREPKPKIMVGGTYSFNDNAIRTNGQLGPLLMEPRDLTSVFVDLMAKYRGWAFMADFMMRSTSNPVTSDPVAMDTTTVQSGMGWNFQGSYLFKNNYEISARYARVDPAADVATHYPATEEVRLGVSKYLRGHSLKLQLDGGLNTLQWAGNPKENLWNIRFQIELGI